MYSKSPSDRDTARLPHTRPISIKPPAACDPRGKGVSITRSRQRVPPVQWYLDAVALLAIVRLVVKGPKAHAVVLAHNDSRVA